MGPIDRPRAHAMVSVLLALAALIALDVAAVLWGADSRDGIDSPEWERRRQWPGVR